MCSVRMQDQRLMLENKTKMIRVRIASFNISRIVSGFQKDDEDYIVPEMCPYI